MTADPLEQVFDLLADGREAEAHAQLDLLIREEPWNGPLHAIRALLRVDQGRLDDAARDAATGVELAEDNGFSHYAVAAVALAREEYPAAITAAREAQRLAAGYLEAALLEARAQAAAGRWPEAVELTRQVLEQEPDNDEAALLHTLAAGAVRGGGLDREAWRALADRFPLNPVARAGAGWTRLSAGHYKDARVEFEQALAIDPSLPWAREGLLVALKARNPVYALLLRAFTWLGRFPVRTRRLLLLAGFLGYNLLRRVVGDHPALGWVIWPLLAVYIAFVVLSWLADPLLNLVLLAGREGRQLLGRDERHAALLVGGCLGLGVALGIAAAITGWDGGYLSALGVGFTSFAVAAAWNRAGRRRAFLQGVTAVAFLAAIGSGLVASPWAEGLFLLTILGIAITTWTSSLAGEGPAEAHERAAP
ncbi:MAG: hypothetical protein IPI38_11475 [Gemmatimonadetes bacterium]|nr:hypothetical protein [Gemmatimonadota bacterium]MBK6780997.1 hypothetical protein [Gemmatimonadota bacterium]MBK7716024.1 hypothetical protein [Gemmatimonadota bacterium]MBK7922983.1 hypothetical protein [Gemmatimonadota bacterium]MBK9066646.1 hypothetical protein [Gemmatimonadota bacterium]